MDGTVVYKVTGSGNDFVMLDGRTEPLERWTPELIREICARGTGVGADGFAVLQPGSRPGAVRFHFFNADGGRSAMCGNAALCATRLSAWLELGPAAGQVVETDSGDVPARCLPGPGQRERDHLYAPERRRPGAHHHGPRHQRLERRLEPRGEYGIAYAAGWRCRHVARSAWVASGGWGPVAHRRRRRAHDRSGLQPR